jgi:hypothetical protein
MDPMMGRRGDARTDATVWVAVSQLPGLIPYVVLEEQCTS